MAAVRFIQTCRLIQLRSVSLTRQFPACTNLQLKLPFTLPSKRYLSSEPEPFIQKENEFAHGLLEKIVAYQTRLVTEAEECVSTIDLDAFLIELDFETVSLDDLISAAKSVSKLSQKDKLEAYSHERFLRLSETITELIPSASNEQIKQIIDIYSKLNIKGQMGSFKRLASRLAWVIKCELDNRPDDWSADSLLFFMDYLNHTNRKALTAGFLERFLPLVDSMTKEQIILLLHSMSISYTSHRRQDLLAKLETKFEEYFDDCSAPEIAVASLGFFSLTIRTSVSKLSTKINCEIEKRNR